MASAALLCAAAALSGAPAGCSATKTTRSPISLPAGCRALARGPMQRRCAPVARARTDVQWVEQAVALAEKGRRTAPPNPWVGAIIVAMDRETVLGEGYHIKAGGPHAEAAALSDAHARGVPLSALETATMFVTLEPCHAGPGKRTPACDEAIVRSGIRRVVIAQLDPDPDFGGAGVAFLRSHGILVEVGVGEAAAAASLEPYLHQRRTKLPFCVLKTALSIDGAVACADGSSQWITGPEARADAHRIRANSQAVVVGAGTALRDEPRLTWRVSGGEEWANFGADGAPPPQPLRVILDARGRVRSGALMDTAEAPTLVLTSDELCEPAARLAWERAGVEYEALPLAPARSIDGPRHLEMRSVLEALGRRRILQAMWEGGPEVHASLLAADGADMLVAYVGNCLLGSSALPWARAPLASTISEKVLWQLRGCEALGQDVRITYARQQPQPGGAGGAR